MTQPSFSKWSSTTTYLLLFSLAQSALVKSQYIPPQAFRRSNSDGNLSVRGVEEPAAPKGDTGTGGAAGIAGGAPPSPDSKVPPAPGSEAPPAGGEKVPAGGESPPASGGNSNSKELWLMSHEDFCIYGLPQGSNGKIISESIGEVVSYCSKSGHNTNLIPDGTLKGVTYVRTPSWVQVSGSGDFSKIGISPEDLGAQFDSSTHNPEGSKLITSQGGDPASDWVTMISAETFCVRACFGDPAFCPTQYDSLGCYFLTSNGVGWDDVYQDCEGDEGDPPGVIDGVTYTPGNGPVPTPSIPAVSNCQAGSAIQNGQTAGPGADGSGSGGGAESTTWVPVQTCLPCTATAGGPAPSGSSSVPREGGAEGGGEPPQASSAASSALGSNNPFASGSSSASASASDSGAPGAAGGAPGEPGAGGTEQVGVTKLAGNSPASSPGPTPAPGGSDLEARSFNWWNNNYKRGAPEPAAGGEGAANGSGGGEGETITKGDQCCFTTWTPSIIGGPGGAKATGSAASGGSKGLVAGATGKGNSSLTGTGSKSAGNGATHSGGPAITSGSGTGGKNGTTAGGGNSTTNGTSNDSSNALSSLDGLWLLRGIGEGGFNKLIGVTVVTGLGLICGGIILV